MGKTRLAVNAAHHQLQTGRFTDGVFFVPLAALQNPAHIVPAIAQAINLPLETGKQNRAPKQQLIDFLHQKQMLLILDNFEHLLRAATLPAELLQAAPQLQIVVTTRERLRLYEEQLFPIEGLTYPEENLTISHPSDLEPFSAPRLFLERVRRIKPRFELAETAVSSLTTLCQLVAGMPLALELAAGWADQLTIPAIVDEIEQGLAILETDLRNVPARHQSITAVFDISWQHLSKHEQDRIALLSVFRGSFTPDAAQTIADTSRQFLQELTQKSLLQWDGENGRYHIHELLRQYLQSRLESTAVQNKHATYYCNIIANESQSLPGVQAFTPAVDRLIQADLDNIRAAWHVATITPNIELLTTACNNLASFYEGHGLLQEGDQLFGDAITAVSKHASTSTTHSEAIDKARAKLLTCHSIFIGWLGNTEQSIQLLHEALTHLDKIQQLDTRFERANVLGWLGDKNNRLGKRAQAWRHHQQSVNIYQELNNPYQLGFSLCSLGATAWHEGNYAQAEHFLKQSLAMLEPLGPSKGLSRTYFWLGAIAASIGDFETDEKLTRKAISILQEVGNPNEAQTRFCTLGYSLALQGKFAESEPILREGIANLTYIGWQGELVWIRPLLVHTLLHLGHYEEALELADASLVECEQAGNLWSAGRVLNFAAAAHLAQENEAKAVTNLSKSRQLLEKTGNQEMLATTLAIQAYAALSTGNEIEKAVTDALRLIIDTHTFTPMLFLLPALALWKIQNGDSGCAIALHSLIQQFDYITQSKWFTDLAMQALNNFVDDADATTVRNAQKVGSEMDLWETAVSILNDLTKIP